jgi:bacterioferritin
MKGNQQLEPIFNGLLKELLYAKDCYRLERAVFKNRGYGKLAKCICDVKEVHDWAARKIIKRMLFLELTPDLSHEFPAVEDQVMNFIVNGIAFETRLLGMVAEAVSDTRGIQDVGTHVVTVEIGKKVEDNVKWFERQLKRFNDVGQQLYLSKMF